MEMIRVYLLFVNESRCGRMVDGVIILPQPRLLWTACMVLVRVVRPWAVACLISHQIVLITQQKSALFADVIIIYCSSYFNLN